MVQTRIFPVWGLWGGHVDMNNYSHQSRLLRQQIIKKSLREQEIWRQKQLDILYRTGRPIFSIERCNLRFYD